MKSQLFKKLAEQIYTDYADVRKLPGERRLGERYVASRATIRAALQELQNGGRLVSDPRRGHTLIPAAPSRAVAAFVELMHGADFRRYLEESGRLSLLP